MTTAWTGRRNKYAISGWFEYVTMEWWGFYGKRTYMSTAELQEFGMCWYEAVS